MNGKYPWRWMLVINSKFLCHLGDQSLRLFCLSSAVGRLMNLHTLNIHRKHAVVLLMAILFPRTFLVKADIVITGRGAWEGDGRPCKAARRSSMSVADGTGWIGAFKAARRDSSSFSDGMDSDRTERHIGSSTQKRILDWCVCFILLLLFFALRKQLIKALY